MVELDVVTADITERSCDLLLLKHADGFYGVDAVIAQLLGFSAGVPQGEAIFLPGRNIEARKVVYIGVGPLGRFRYSQIRKFGRTALEFAAKNSGHTQVICTPIHGSGYGLDEREAFLSLVAGFLDAIERGACPDKLERIEVVELSSRRATRLQEILSTFIESSSRTRDRQFSGRDLQSFTFTTGSTQDLSSFGDASEQKRKLFVAMPFSPEHSDVWDIAIQEACQKSGILCERVDEQAYTGDILRQITSRLRNSNGVWPFLTTPIPTSSLRSVLRGVWGSQLY